MAYDLELAERIGRLVDGDPELTEKKMFGGRLPHRRQHGHRRQRPGGAPGTRGLPPKSGGKR
jgi:hypothetical protein